MVRNGNEVEVEHDTVEHDTVQLSGRGMQFYRRKVELSLTCLEPELGKKKE